VVLLRMFSLPFVAFSFYFCLKKPYLSFQQGFDYLCFIQIFKKYKSPLSARAIMPSLQVCQESRYLLLNNLGPS